MSAHSTNTTDSAPRPLALWQLVAISGALVYAYLPTLRVFADKWVNDEQYSHGLLVPFFSAYLIWRAWKAEPRALKPLPVIGCALLAALFAARAASGAILFYQLDAVALLLSLVAVALAFGGVPLMKLALPAILFLGFMVPLPYELERNVGEELKTVATMSSTFVLQTLGLPAIRDGNLILIDEVRLGIVDACSGLKMLVTFAAFSVGAALLMRRSRFEKLMVLLGIVPIALVSNVARVTATGVMYSVTTDQTVAKNLHDWLGYAMMVFGMALLALELWVLKKLVVEAASALPPGAARAA
jgi:exosortase